MNTIDGVLSHTHVIYDLYGCDENILLNSQSTLAGLLHACSHAGLTVVSHSVHTYPNQAYSCTIYLAESHVSLHTWPEISYCALDIFLCNGNIERAEKCLLAVMKPIKSFKLGLSRAKRCSIGFSDRTPTRGLPGYYEAYQTRRVTCRKQSRFQFIEILENDVFGSILLLDNDVQLSTSDEAIYHEFLVHPVMRAHHDPRTVLIIGGGDGGTLREVLKYPNVTKAVLVDIDEDVVRCCRKHLPAVSQGAFDDPRAEVVFANAANFTAKQLFDVVIVDLTAPRGVSLSAYKKLAANIHSHVSHDGMLAMHSGWWWRSEIDYPSIILDKFSSVILADQWIPSFACFWSFMFAWRNDLQAEDALKRIATRNHTHTVKHFEGTAYAQNAFARQRFLG